MYYFFGKKTNFVNGIYTFNAILNYKDYCNFESTLKHSS